MRRDARIDANQPEIVEKFRSLGWSVLNISQLKNCCDIFVSKAGDTYAVEIKDSKKPPSARKLTDGELRFKESWKGKWALVTCHQDVININNQLEKQSNTTYIV